MVNNEWGVLIGLADEDEIERLVLAYSPKLQALLDTAEQRIKESGGIRHDDFWGAVEAESRGAGEQERLGAIVNCA